MHGNVLLRIGMADRHAKQLCQSGKIERAKLYFTAKYKLLASFNAK